jgi:hypothetical protein
MPIPKSLTLATATTDDKAGAIISQPSAPRAWRMAHWGSIAGKIWGESPYRHLPLEQLRWCLEEWDTLKILEGLCQARFRRVPSQE